MYRILKPLKFFFCSILCLWREDTYSTKLIVRPWGFIVIACDSSHYKCAIICLNRNMTDGILTTESSVILPATALLDVPPPSPSLPILFPPLRSLVSSIFFPAKSQKMAERMHWRPEHLNRSLLIDLTFDEWILSLFLFIFRPLFLEEKVSGMGTSRS